MEINKNMTIEEIISVDRGIANILMASGENLEQACAVHGIDCDQLVGTINDWLASKNA